MFEIAGAILLAVVVGIVMFVVGRRSARSEPPAPDPSRSLFGKITRLEDEQRRAAEIIDGMNEGVVVFGESLTPVMANAAARHLLTLPAGQLPPRIPSDEVTSTARRSLSERTVIESELNWTAAGLSLRVRSIPLADDRGVVMFLSDVTDELRTQQLRRQFVANASHELKTPVASLKTLVEAIQGSTGNDAAATERFTGRLSNETDRLVALIDDLMDLSRVEDPAAMKLGEVDLSDIVAREVKEIEGPAGDARIALDASVVAGVRVRGDERHLELMVRNLLSNAVRYTLDGGHVVVTLGTDGDRAALTVEDDGIGIPLQAQARVFERFYRVDEDRARASGGTGLGLSIVKNVAESHGGTVALTSELDEGSTFTITLPLVEDPA
jgi:two-component system sensor histidine kinase SenX3